MGSGRRLVLQAVKPGQILLDQIGDGQVVRAARQAFAAFGAMPGLFDDIQHPLVLLDVGAHALDHALQPDGELNLDLDQVDMVFLTGGTSFVPAVRRIFESRFGAGRLRSGHEFTSVARGLALNAAHAARVS